MDRELQVFGYDLTVHEVTDARLIDLYDEQKKRIMRVPMEMVAVNTVFRSLIEQEKRSMPAHKMFLSIIETLEGKMEKIVIDDLQTGKFFATLYFCDCKGRKHTVKAEACDAIAVALCAPPCLIYVMESIIHAARKDRDNRVYWYSIDNEELLNEARRASSEELNNLPANDLKQLLKIATQTEDFEFASRLKEGLKAYEEKVEMIRNILDSFAAEEQERIMEEFVQKLEEKFNGQIRVTRQKDS
jgi:bifunctional DNase/RNase